jgi:SulP family sulfate permease
VIVYGIVQQYGLDGLTVATLMAGVILVAMGLAKLGGAIKFIPHPVIIGFTSGIALIIFSSQIKDLLGLRLQAVPAGFVAKWVAYAHSLGSTDPRAAGVAALALALMLLWPRLNRTVPGPFVALLATTLLVALLRLPVDTIGSRFGVVATSLPAPRLPHLSAELVRAMVGPAFTIAMLAAIESLLSAVVADGMIGSRHRSNMELVAQGVANLASPLFGGIPATGAIARTATNVKNGGRTPVAGIAHALTLLLITLFFGRWVAHIPMATLAAILVVVAYHMSEWRSFRAELSAPRSDLVVLLVTFILTVAVDLTVAIQVGMVLAAFLFMRRMAEVTNVRAVTGELADAHDDRYGEPRLAVPAGVEVYEVNGPFFFGAAEQFIETLSQVSRRPRVLVIRMRNVPAIDSTGLHALGIIVRRCNAAGARVILSDVHSQPMMALGRSTLLEELGEENLLGSLADALEAAREEVAVREVIGGR